MISSALRTGVLEDAPQSLVVLSRLDDPDARAEFQRDLVALFPNISALDATFLIESLNSILGRVSLAIRFMALFTVATGLLILVGSISTSRFHRARLSCFALHSERLQ